MMEVKDSPAMTDFDGGTSTGKARHTQWRKLSRKRRRALIRRTLRRLEREAKRKSVFVGMEDYSHVQSLVFSELPYNPNGHHCSCNCLDEVAFNPELEVYGWSYGKQLKSSGMDHLSSPEGDDTSLRNDSTGSEGFRHSANEDEKIKTEEGNSVAMGIVKKESTSPGKQLSNGSEERISLRNASRQIRQGCHCDRVVPRGNTSGSSITKQMSQMGEPTRTLCKNCQGMLNVINRFKDFSSNRRVSIAKEDGTLRSRIFSLRQKLRRYSDVIKRNEYLAVQERVKRRLTVGDKLQKKALSLSDRMKMMKFRESYYWNENKELKQRLSGNNEFIVNGKHGEEELEKGNYEVWKIQVAGDEELEERDGIADLMSDKVGYLSARKAGRRRKGIELPAVMEEEEFSREIHSSDGRIEHCHGLHEDNQLKAEPKNYDILFINHSDNEVENESFEKDDNSEDSDNFEDDGDFARSWPTYKNSLKLGSQKYPKGDESEQDSIRRLVHRLDSGLSFGPTDAEILQDESLVSSVNRVEQEMNSISKLPDDSNGAPLVERQHSFGQVIRNVIRQEIYKNRGSGSQDGSRAFENRENRDDSEEELERKRKILEDNLTEYVEEAKKKNEMVEGLLIERDSSTPDVQTSNGESSKEMTDHEEDESGRGIGSPGNIAKKAELVDLSTLRTLAQKHQTFKSLRNIDEEMYQVSEGIDKLNKFRMLEAKARTVKDNDRESDEILPLSQRERDYSIPDPINKRSIIEERITDNNKTIAKIDYSYDLLRDLRFLILNQNTSRAVSYSYFDPAPPYLKTKWQKRIKRGFLRGVKEQKVNEVQLEKVEDVTFKTMDRNEIHKVTLKSNAKGKTERSMSSGSSPPSRLSTARRSSSIAKFDRESAGTTLPPLKLPGSRASSRADTVFEEEFGSRSGTMPVSNNDATLQQAFKKLEMRHKFLDKAIMMKNVIKLSSNIKNKNGIDRLSFTMDSSRQESDRKMSEGEASELFKSRLKSNRRQSIAAVQNIAVRDQLSGRMSVTSNERRRFSLMNAIKEY